MSKEVLLGKILEKFEVLNQILNSRGFDAIKSIYLTYWKHSGQMVSISEPEGGSIVRLNLVIEGLTDSGYLLACK
jgi:biotin-(acetyl-CoA carboxylase) ligase